MEHLIKSQNIFTTEYTESTEGRQRKSKHKGFDLLCALCVLGNCSMRCSTSCIHAVVCGSRFSQFGSGYAGFGHFQESVWLRGGRSEQVG